MRDTRSHTVTRSVGRVGDERILQEPIVDGVQSHRYPQSPRCRPAASHLSRRYDGHFQGAAAHFATFFVTSVFFSFNLLS